MLSSHGFLMRYSKFQKSIFNSQSCLNCAKKFPLIFIISAVHTFSPLVQEHPQVIFPHFNFQKSFWIKISSNRSKDTEITSRSEIPTHKSTSRYTFWLHQISRNGLSTSASSLPTSLCVHHFWALDPSSTSAPIWSELSNSGLRLQKSDGNEVITTSKL